nr:MAG TPA: hypothetical protein [Caudoviricetes sp.]
MHPTNQGRRVAPAMRQDPSHLSTMWPRGDIAHCGLVGRAIQSRVPFGAGKDCYARPRGGGR